MMLASLLWTVSCNSKKNLIRLPGDLMAQYFIFGKLLQSMSRMVIQFCSLYFLTQISVRHPDLFMILSHNKV